MSSQYLAKVGIVCAVLIPGAAQNPCNKSASGNQTVDKEKQSESSDSVRCLPIDVKPDSVVTYALRRGKNVTVKDTLDQLKAHCDDGKLFDGGGKEIKFYALQCWGNPPPGYLKMGQAQHEKIEQLRKKYTVVLMSCNPRTE